MARDLGERVARLESEAAQHRKELDARASQAASQDKCLVLLKQEVARLTAWRGQVRERTRRVARSALYVAGSAGLELYSGVWSQVLGGLLKQLARGG